MAANMTVSLVVVFLSRPGDGAMCACSETLVERMDSAASLSLVQVPGGTRGGMKVRTRAWRLNEVPFPRVTLPEGRAGMSYLSVIFGPERKIHALCRCLQAFGSAARPEAVPESGWDRES